MNTRAALVSVLFALPAISGAQPVDPHLYDSLKWRLLGPFRGGKATSASGVPGNPAIYYFGTAGSGVWKTVDGGQVWTCVSDSVRLTSIGAVAVAPSRPDTVYAGAAGFDGTAGLYRSTDAGGHWDRVALEGHAVASVVIDPHNPEVVLAAAGDTGVMRTADGGKTWTSVLPDSKIGAVWLVLDPDDAKNVYAGTRPAGAGGRGGGGFGGGRGAAPVTTPATDSQIWRSSDEGLTWKKTNPDGLPGGSFGTISLAVAPGTGGQRVYDYVAQGVFRSDDGGAHWRRATDDPRLIGGGQFHDILVDPRDANLMFATQTSLYRSTDAGNTWESYAGAPSGADFNYVWIDPANDKDMIVAVDQGTEISMDAGRTWTTWFNQPTGQFYNAATDHQFPFFVYASQQDSGTVATPIAGRGGQITYRDWYTTNGFENARITPDPGDPNYLYATGWYGSVLRVNKNTGQTQHVFERIPKYRESGAPPIVFSPFDPKTLYLGTQFLLATHDRGMHWEEASPDLTVRDDAKAAASEGTGGRGGRGGPAIDALAFSPRDPKVIWAGTSNGMLQLSRDGGAHWVKATPGGLSETVAIANIEASASDAERAFVVAGGGRGGRGAGATPAEARVYRTADYGQTWKLVNDGLPASPVHAVREDPLERNLVFAALDSGVFVSFNGGDRWQPLELNLPAASCRDLALEQNTLVVATFGRALWALDDISPLRELAAKGADVSASDTYLFPPAPAVRTQWDTYTDTPFNPDVASAENPPEGAVIDYYLKSPPPGDLKLEIYDSADRLVRSYSSAGDSSLGYKVNVPAFWLAPPQLLPKRSGLNRFAWDLRYPDPAALLFTYYGIHVKYFEYTLADHAVPHNTPWHEPQGPMVLPGQYEIRLTAGGRIQRRTITVKLDPRLTYSTEELQRQLQLAQDIAANMNVTRSAYEQVEQVVSILKRSEGAQELEKKGEALLDTAGPPAGFGPLNRDLARLLTAVDQSDSPPASGLVEAFHGMCTDVKSALSRWADLSMQIPQTVASIGDSVRIDPPCR